MRISLPPLGTLLAAAWLGASPAATAAQPCAGFGDVDLDDAMCRNVEWIRNRGVTLGCVAGASYCPSGNVTRLQMAAFMNRLGSALTPDVRIVEASGAALDLVASATLCTLALPARSQVRTATIDVSLSATGTNVQYQAEVVGRLGNAAFAPLSTASLAMGGPATSDWQNARLHGRLVLPANVTGDVAVRVRRGSFPGSGPLAQAQCQLRASVAEYASLRPPRSVTLNASLASPWGLAFLPDGRMVVTQKAGSMLLLSPDGASILATLSGVPVVDSAGQGGLLDVALDPEFDLVANPWIYWTYAEAGTGGSGTAVARGRLVGTTLQNVAVIFRQLPKLAGAGHYGSRLAFLADGTLLVTLGERQYDNPANPTTLYAQNLANHLGKVVRIARDGSIPSGNPAFGAGAQPALWSIGHRNPQGAAIHPVTGELWLNEHGPQGGDELNRVVPGGNYGWPLRSYGCPYGAPVGEACRVGGGTHAPAFVEPAAYWVPTSIAPAGMVFYTGDKFPEWHGNVLFGALAGTALWRVTLDGNVVGSRERLFGSLGERIRNVRQGPDGWLYLLTDSGKLIRIDR